MDDYAPRRILSATTSGGLSVHYVCVVESERNVGEEHQALTASLRAALERALQGDEHRVRRLQHAGTSVRFRIAGSDAAVTLLLDRAPAQIELSGGPAEIEIELTEQQLRQFITGDLPMPAAVVGGAVAVRGPIRKYLTVDPIIRGLLAEVAAAPDD